MKRKLIHITKYMSISPELRGRLAALNELTKKIKETAEDLESEREILAKAKIVHENAGHSDELDGWIKTKDHNKFEELIEEKIKELEKHLENLRKQKDEMGDFSPR